MTINVTSAEVQKDFEAFHDRALIEPVQVSRGGKDSVVIVSAEQFRALRQTWRRVIAVEDLTDAEIALIEKAEIPAEYRYHSSEVPD